MSERRGEPRVQFDGSVRLRYRLFQEFLEENAANIKKRMSMVRRDGAWRIAGERAVP